MEHIKDFDSFLNEAKIADHSNRHNTFYWNESKGELIYQVPYIFPGEREKTAVLSADLVDEDRKKIYDIVEKANDEMNKEVDTVQKAIAKIGEKAADDINKIIKASKK